MIWMNHITTSISTEVGELGNDKLESWKVEKLKS